MNKVLAIVCFAVLAVAVNAELLSQKEIIKAVGFENQWVAGVNQMFEGMPEFAVRRLMGFKKSENRPVLPVVDQVQDVPAQFDARTQWPNCPSIGTIQNQAMCGSCWAFGAVESITDRFCIHKNSTEQLSFEDMVACDGSDNGCEGGDAFSAHQYAKQKGLVTAECSPYTVPTCPPAQQPCLKFVNTPKCVKSCNNTDSWNNDKHKLSTIYGVSPKGMETEMYTNGPVEACFNVYEDFLAYKSGVYKHITGKLLGGHCIKLLGYGTLNGTDYWLAANSWTTYWGDNGYFMIQRGNDECGIESDVVSGMP